MLKISETTICGLKAFQAVIRIKWLKGIMLIPMIFGKFLAKSAYSFGKFIVVCKLSFGIDCQVD